MDEESLEYLKTSLENENNQAVFDLTTAIIKKNKEEILSDLPITKKKIAELKRKLKEYRYVDEIQELHIGSFTRWINLKEIDELLCSNNDNLDDFDIHLVAGGILLDITIQDTTKLILKNFVNKHFTINMDENLIFQKLTSQEKIILYAIDNIDKIKD